MIINNPHGNVNIKYNVIIYYTSIKSISVSFDYDIYDTEFYCWYNKIIFFRPNCVKSVGRSRWWGINFAGRSGLFMVNPYMV